MVFIVIIKIPTTTTTMKNKGVCNSTKNSIEILQYILTKCPASVQVKNADGRTPLQYYNKEHDYMLMIKCNSFGEDDKVRRNK